MEQTKVNFISELLSDPKLQVHQKERIFFLIKEELDKIEDSETYIITELDNIKKAIGMLDEVAVEDVKEIDSMDVNFQSNISNALPHYIDPSNTAKFLVEYNQNPVLKTTTHEIDSDQMNTLLVHLGLDIYDFRIHLQAIQSEYKKLQDKYIKEWVKKKPVYTINDKLSSKIYYYLFDGGNGWSEQRIRNSWDSDYLKTWAELNPGKCPNPGKSLGYDPYVFDTQNRLAEYGVNNFLQLVLYFKKQVTIRHDNNLRDLVELWSRKFEDTVEIDFTRVSTSIEFFTDVEKLEQVFRRIVEMCLDAGGGIKPKIRLMLTEMPDQRRVVFSIVHLNSVFKKTFGSLFRRSGYGEKFTNIIQNQVNGLCNWQMIAEFETADRIHNKYIEVELWPFTRKAKGLEKCEGVCFNLIYFR
jgi:hypothetical protein